MGRMRFTIAGSMGLVALAAMAFAAFRHPSPLVASGIFTAAVVALFAAAVAAISLPGRQRAIWASFALCGAGYLLLGLGPWATQGAGPHLISEPLLGFAYSSITGYDNFLFESEGRLASSVFRGTEFWGNPQRPTLPTRSTMGTSMSLLNTYNGDLKPFPWPVSRLAHSLIGLLAAAAGGLFALVLTRGRAELTPKPPDHP